jgi:hypothetical protein
MTVSERLSITTDDVRAVELGLTTLPDLWQRQHPDATSEQAWSAVRDAIEAAAADEANAADRDNVFVEWGARLRRD